MQLNYVNFLCEIVTKTNNLLSKIINKQFTVKINLLLLIFPLSLYGIINQLEYGFEFLFIMWDNTF